MEKEKVILAYSGGLDTSVIMAWLKENTDFDRVQANLKSGGYREKDVTIPSGRAMVFGLLCAGKSETQFP